MALMPVVDAVDVSSLRLFLAVVELGSVSKAAARHGLTQPSATAKLQKLERQLGVQLLDRSPSGSVATTAGVHLAPACADVVAAAVALVDRAGERRDEQTRLAVTATRHVADHFLPAWVSGAGLDGVRLDLVEGDTLTVAQTVRSGEAAVGFTEGPGAPLGLRSEVVASEEVVPVVGPSHRWFSRRRPVAGRDLASATLVLGRRGSGTLDVVEAALAAHGLEAGGRRIEVAGTAAALLAAVNGAGVAFVPRCRAAGEVQAGRLRVVPVAGVRIEQPVRVVWRGTRPAEAPARRLLDHVR
jgi:DNA-binding transcriptional LysR family regulator